MVALRREARLVRKLKHPGIVPVYEIGETPAGIPCYTMRFVAGERLERALPLDQREVADFLARARSLRRWMPELGLPAFDDDQSTWQRPAPENEAEE